MKQQPAKRQRESAESPAPHVFIGGPAWETRPVLPPVIDTERLAALAAEVTGNGVKVLACVNKTLIRTELAAVCGYTNEDEDEPIIPWRVGRDFGCLELFSVAAHGASPAEQNMGYTMTNHQDMLRDEPRVALSLSLSLSLSISLSLYIYHSL